MTKSASDFVPKSHKYAPPEKSSLAKKVTKNKLKKIGVRPFFLDYCINLYRRRFFIWHLSSSGATNKNQNNYLGQLWSIINPVIQIIIYFFIFGKMLHTNRGITNFFTFLVIGTFIFDFMSSASNNGARSLDRQKGLMRALDFPRAVIPISDVLKQMILTWPPILVMFVLVIANEPITFKWILFPIVLVEIFLFITGTVFIYARLSNSIPDFANLVPVVMQFMRYLSGVFYLPSAFLKAGGIIGFLFNYQPFGLYLNLIRSCLMTEFQASAKQWLVGFLYAIIIFLVGFIFFWKNEANYGKK
jgi:teichoic acid transport system permease protein